jgi:nitrogen fixation protein NifB
MSSKLNFSRHPCFNANVKGRYGRIHLPVAPLCNVSCNYCNRKYDCVNESRPGVASAILTPAQALEYMEKVLEVESRITVAGIAGPGDAFANPSESLETLGLIRARFPEMLLCVASNGLGIAPYIADLADLEVSHVTITVNAVNPYIGQMIYAWVRDGRVIYRGLKAAQLLLGRQIEAIAALRAKGIVVKVNTIVIPGVNDRHVAQVAAKMASLGVEFLNCMPMCPNADTQFANIPEPTAEAMTGIRNEARAYLPQISHCMRCRADAVGLLNHDRSEEFRGCLSACSALASGAGNRPLAAAEIAEGILLNQDRDASCCFRSNPEEHKGITQTGHVSQGRSAQ